MKSKITIEQLLCWRLAQAEAAAPLPPRAAELLALTRPWWETLPEHFQALVAQLSHIQIAYGHAMAELPPSHTGHPVPTLLIRGEEKLETSARTLYFNVRDGRLRLRLQLETQPAPAPKTLEVTFVTEQLRPLFSTLARLSVDHEYSVDTELPEELAYAWERLKVTDKMPFRWIFRADKEKADGS